MNQLLKIMARLRDPENGCPWDVEQNFSTIAPHTIEEAYEVADAIEKNDFSELKDELGDLLFQVVFHSRMAEELGHFNFSDVASAISDKMIRRHPHVFADATIDTAEAQTVHWEDIKEAERGNKVSDDDSALAGVTSGLPALLRAQKLQKRAARVGFDWPDPEPVFVKISEEIDEIHEVTENGSDHDRLEDEIGDLLFACVNLARKFDLDAESALRRGNLKFERRFRRIESLLKDQGRAAEQATLEEMEGLWGQAKSEELA